MASMSLDPRQPLQLGRNNGVMLDEIQGLIKVYKDGHVERPQIVPNTPCTLPPELAVTAKDIIIDKLSNLWARFYVPNQSGKLPVVVYFHGGGFCVGSAAWSCYHNFLGNLSAKAGCVIISVNYRLAPENRLPAAYDDGVNAVTWVKQCDQYGSSDQKWWSSKCNFASLFLAGDSAGANMAHHVAARLGANGLKGVILIQPFFGGESRTESEKFATQPLNSALTLSASDAYWRLSLPAGASRDHPWCNPLVTRMSELKLPATMVCVSDMDILKDRNLNYCAAMIRAGKRVEKMIYKGVGHAFQILHNSPMSQTRTQEMVSHIKAFINQ